MSRRLTRARRRELRRRAEQARAGRRRARLARDDQRRTADRVLARPPTRWGRNDATHAADRIGASLGASRLLCRRTRTLVDRFEGEGLSISPPYVRIALEVARHPWVRPADALVRPSLSTVLRHLLARFPLPGMLERAILDLARLPVGDMAWVVRLVAFVGRGASLATPGLLPVPLTRRMRHLFLHAPGCPGPTGALRYAQIVGVGGSEDVAHAVLDTHLVALQS